MSPVERVSRWTIRAGARAIVARHLDLEVSGLEHLPRSGPLLIAARHYHHLYDGCALLALVPRPLHLLVALDWAGNRRDRWVMESACRAARWPVVLRSERLSQEPRVSAYRAGEGRAYLRRAMRDAVSLLRDGHALVVFPEGYPVVDPNQTPRDGGAFLPFRPGFVTLAERAGRDGVRVPIVPAGFAYQRGERWRVVLRFGPPLYLGDRANRACLLHAVEERVRRLSAPL